MRHDLCLRAKSPRVAQAACPCPGLTRWPSVHSKSWYRPRPSRLCSSARAGGCCAARTDRSRKPGRPRGRHGGWRRAARCARFGNRHGRVDPLAGSSPRGVGCRARSHRRVRRCRRVAGPRWARSPPAKPCRPSPTRRIQTRRLRTSSKTSDLRSNAPRRQRSRHRCPTCQTKTNRVSKAKQALGSAKRRSKVATAADQ